MAPAEQIPISKLYLKAAWGCSALSFLPGRAWGSSLKVNCFIYLFSFTFRIHSYRGSQLLVQLGQISPGLKPSTSLCDERLDVFFAVDWFLGIELLNIIMFTELLLACCLNLTWYTDRPKSTFLVYSQFCPCWCLCFCNQDTFLILSHNWHNDTLFSWPTWVNHEYTWLFMRTSMEKTICREIVTAYFA